MVFKGFPDIKGKAWVFTCVEYANFVVIQWVLTEFRVQSMALVMGIVEVAGACDSHTWQSRCTDAIRCR